ncbi:DUF2804 domain-containing protein [Undibacterium sp. TJN19]|uniref:DUF2804 domain-containing protein n=1 Tax=Undibacterium sp. TJN19 TaxID=3413055 RepID=UPI003BF379A0
MLTSHLSPAPANVLNPEGQVQFGKFSGAPACIDWSTLAAPYRRSKLWQVFHHKHWHYVALATEEIFCGIAIVDIGWTNTAFAYVFDRQQGKLLASYSQDGIPGLTAQLNKHPATGADCRFQFLKNCIHFQHVAGTDNYHLSLQCGAFSIDAVLNGSQAAPGLFAAGEVEGGTVHATFKSAAMRLNGEVRLADSRFALDSGIGSYDHSNGFLARETAWRWASAHAPGLGFNLQAGYFGRNENALWLDGQLIALGAAQFAFDQNNPMAAWHIHTDDGLLDLHFQPEGFRAENKNLLIAASRYVQPIGTFSGWVRASVDAPVRQIENLVGVTEDHFSRW